MVSTADSRLQTQAMPVDDLVAMVHRGEVRVPAFQRGLRWQQSDVIKLFDSIVRGYPIGNLLLWKRSAEESRAVKIGALSIDAPAMDGALFVVDGQQRITSLANALSDQGHADARFALAYDVEREKFVRAQGRTSAEIPLPVIFDLSRLLRWFSAHPELLQDELLVERANKVAKAIREFRVPVYIVEQTDENVLRDIFDRMNNFGRQLTRAEVFSALHASSSGERVGAAQLQDLTAIAMEIHSVTQFGLLDDDTVLLAMLARRGPDISRDLRREFAATSQHIGSEFPGEAAAEARSGVAGAAIKAIQFLQDSASTPHFSFLPYRYLLVVLTRFFAHFPEPSAATLRNLRRWYWRAASLGPELTKGNITYATRALCGKIQPGDEVGSVSGLLGLTTSTRPRGVKLAEFKTNYAATRLLLAAMWHARPCKLSLSGEPVPFTSDELLTALGEGHSAVRIARTLFQPVTVQDRELRGMAANRVLLPASENDFVESPSDTLRQLALNAQGGQEAALRVLASHVVDRESAAALVDGQPTTFLTRRQESLTRLLEDFLERQTEWRFEDTPPLDALDLDEPNDDDEALDSGELSGFEPGMLPVDVE